MSVRLADMAGTLTVDELIRVLRAEAELLAGEAAQAFVTDPVPTCPEWSVRDLVEHTGGVHRWAATVVKGALTRDVPDTEQELLFRAPADPDELLAWFTRGAHELMQALEAAPADLRTFVFLKSAPPPRQFWARRQAHETTIHRVDALAARLGRMPSTHEADVSREVAVDGLDELLVGFVQRRSSRLRHTEPYWVCIAPTDVDVVWTVALSDDPPVTTKGADPRATGMLSGTAAALYLGLWNRGDDVAESGSEDALGLWRDRVRISW
jgi:uncharacterized protein (TIGR03083 family)